METETKQVSFFYNETMAADFEKILTEFAKQFEQDVQKHEETEKHVSTLQQRLEQLSETIKSKESKLAQLEIDFEKNLDLTKDDKFISERQTLRDSIRELKNLLPVVESQIKTATSEFSGSAQTLSNKVKFRADVLMRASIEPIWKDSEWIGNHNTYDGTFCEKVTANSRRFRQYVCDKNTG
jgi:chromosome segregation ATPase